MFGQALPTRAWKCDNLGIGDMKTENLQRTLVSALGRAATRLCEAGLPNELALEMERLARQVNDPRVVGGVGRVNAGKSTFVNALLDEDLAAVGATETTATIDYFRLGKADPDQSLRCRGRRGRTTYVDRAFLDGFQSNNRDTLRYDAGIGRLEYLFSGPQPGTKRVLASDHGVRVRASSLLAAEKDRTPTGTVPFAVTNPCPLSARVGLGDKLNQQQTSESRKFGHPGPVSESLDWILRKGIG